MKKLIPLFLVAAGLAVAGCNKTDTGSNGSPPPSSSSATTPGADTNSAAVPATNAPAQ